MQIHKNILMLHGWGADSSQLWFQETKEYFTPRGYGVHIPDLPASLVPKEEEWLRVIESFNLDENWIVITHSLGGVAILRYLEQVYIPIHQLILVATPYNALEFGALENFFSKEFEWERIKENCPKIDLIYGDEDPVVPLEHGQIYKEKLGANLTVVSDVQHMFKMDMKLLDKLVKE